jgi:two-component system sensor kinase FixL
MNDRARTNAARAIAHASDAALAERLAFEHLLANLSAKFANLPGTHLEAEIEGALRRLLELLGFDHGAFGEFTEAGQAIVLASAAVEGVEPMPVGTLPYPFDWYLAELRAGRVVAKRCLPDDLPPEAVAEAEYCRRSGLRSNLTIPLSVNGQVVCAIAFGAFRSTRAWPEDLVLRLKLVGEVFAQALARRRLEAAQRDLLRFEQLVADLSASLAGASAPSVIREIDHALQQILRFFNADECRVFEIISSKRARLRFVAYADGVTPEHIPLQYERRFPWEYGRVVGRGEVCVINSVDEYPAEARHDRTSAEALGIRSRLSVPIASEGVIRYVLTLAGTREAPVWPAQCAPRLRLVGETLAAALARGRTDHALRANEERFRLAVESAPNGVMIVSQGGHIILVNRELERAFGYTRGELTGLSVETLVPQAVRGHHPAYRKHFFRHPKPLRIGAGRDLYGLRKDGTQFPVEIGLNPIRTREGQFVLATVVDITERKRAEDALRESNRRLIEAQRIARLGSWDWDLMTNEVKGSEEAYRIFGIQPERFTNLVDIVHADDRSALQAAMKRARANPSDKLSLEYRIVRPDGKVRFIHHGGEIKTGENGSPVRAVGTIQDITELREAELETRRLRMQLWHSDRVARTGALTASLAHELNQPLAAILSNAQAGLRFLAREPPGMREIRDILADIVRDDKRAGAVISGLRTMVRRQEAGREKLDLAATLREMLDLLHSELIECKVEVNTNCEPGCTVMADKAQIQQVLLNLVMNAIDAMRDQPTDQRRLDLAVVLTDEHAVRTAVRDRGVGIPQEKLATVFDAFWTTKARGMGLGLAVCRSIVEAHGGTIWVDANHDRGVTFQFSLPTAAGTP